MTVGYRAVGFVLALVATAGAEPVTPTERAQAVLAAQLQVIADPSALVATLAPDALVLGNGSFAVGHTSQTAAVVADLGRAASGLGPLSAKIDSLEAAGSDDAVWLSAHIAMTHSGWRGRARPEVTTARMMELVVRDGGSWRVVALAFETDVTGKAPTLTLDQPGRGPLTRMLGELDELESELVDSRELAVGVEDARRALAPWHHRSTELVGAVEVRGTTWAWAAGEVEASSDYRARLRVVMFATRATTASQRWQVVAADAVAVTTGNAPE